MGFHLKGLDAMPLFHEEDLFFVVVVVVAVVEKVPYLELYYSTFIYDKCPKILYNKVSGK